MVTKPELLLPLKVNPIDLLPEEELEVDNYDPSAKVPAWMQAAVAQADAQLASGARVKP